MEHVYLLQVDCKLKSGQSLVKIGLTARDDVSQRIAENQSVWAKRNLKLITRHTVACKDSKSLETALHLIFKGRRVPIEEIAKKFGQGKQSGDGEFFTLEERHIKKAIAEMNAYAMEEKIRPNQSLATTGAISWEPFIIVIVAGLILLGITRSEPKPLTNISKVAETKTIDATPYDAANIREAPNGKITGVLTNSTPVIVIKVEGDWVKTDRGWVWAKFVR